MAGVELLTHESLILASRSANEAKSLPRTTLETVRKRLCSREGTVELLSFLGWLFIITVHVAQLWALWWFFWQYVVGDSNKRQSQSQLNIGDTFVQTAHHSLMASHTKTAFYSAGWLGWFTTAVITRRLFKRLMPAMVR